MSEVEYKKERNENIIKQIEELENSMKDGPAAPPQLDLSVLVDGEEVKVDKNGIPVPPTG